MYIKIVLKYRGMNLDHLSFSSRGLTSLPGGGGQWSDQEEVDQRAQRRKRLLGYLCKMNRKIFRYFNRKHQSQSYFRNTA